MNNNELGMTGAYKKKESEEPNRPLSTNYQATAQPQTSFDNLGKDLLKNVEKVNNKELLNTVNKSIVIPASVWCEFHAILYASEHDYSYELLEEMMSDFIIKNKLTKDDDYRFKKQMLEKEEIKKIKKKKKAKK